MYIQQRGRRFQLRITSKLLSRPFFHSFDTWEEAHSYGTQLEAMLARGVVPQDLLIRLQEPKARSDAAVVDVMRAMDRASCPKSISRLRLRENSSTTTGRSSARRLGNSCSPSATKVVNAAMSLAMRA